MRFINCLLSLSLCILLTSALSAQPIDSSKAKTAVVEVKPEPAKPEPKWYDLINVRGYMQARYNRLLETNSDLQCEQCDRSWGGNGGFFLRRMRLIFFGQIHERVYFYIQPDFASSVSTTSLHFGQLRDAYIDLGIDKKSTFRFRIGQSKIPFGFENMQSSQNRLSLDRDDAINSAASNERELGVFFYWAPDHIRKRFSELVKSGLKGSGDYGVFGAGVYNGQTTNKPDLNRDVHAVARVSYPFKLKNGQFIETGVQAYSGKTIVSTLTSGVKGADKFEYLDQRAAASFILYPQPFGIQAEYNIGTGPQYNPTTDSIEQKRLHGGYVLMSYRMHVKGHNIIPFARYQYYEGGKKHETDARSYKVKELEFGVEWSPFKAFELSVAYHISDRTFEDKAKPVNQQKGNLLRIQAQVNF